MTDIRLRPITIWAGDKTPPWDRERMPGARKASAVFKELQREIRLLGADTAVVETFHREKDLRQDGMLRAGAALPSAPGVVVFVENQITGPLRFACDRYAFWLDNLRAVTLTLEALRGIDRWGVAKSKEQYKGWAALPGVPHPTETPPCEDSPQEKAAKRLLDLADCPIMRETIDQVLNDERKARSVYNQAMKKHHPDVGGDRYKFEEARQCWQTLEAHNS